MVKLRTSFSKWLGLRDNQTKDTYHYVGSGTNAPSEEVRSRSHAASVVHIHGPYKGFRHHFNEAQWESLLINSARLCIIRNPIEKFESDFHFAIQESAGFQIPHTPGLIVESKKPLKTCSADYFSQGSTNQISINDWVQLLHEYHLSYASFQAGGSANYFNSDTKDASKCLKGSFSPYFNLESLSNFNRQLAQWFGIVPNQQFIEILDNLGEDFILRPRLKDEIDMLLTTELLDNLVSMNIIKLEWFRQFTIFREASLQPADYSSIIDVLKNNKINATNSSIKNKHRLDPLSRIRFYEMSRKSFIAWHSSLTRGCEQLKSFVNNV